MFNFSRQSSRTPAAPPATRGRTLEPRLTPTAGSATRTNSGPPNLSTARRAGAAPSNASTVAARRPGAMGVKRATTDLASERSSTRSSGKKSAVVEIDPDEVAFKETVRENAELQQQIEALHMKQRRLTRDMGELSQEYGNRVTEVRRRCKAELRVKDARNATKVADIKTVKEGLEEAEKQAEEAEAQERESAAMQQQAEETLQRAVDLKAEKELDAQKTINDVLNEKTAKDKYEKTLAELKEQHSKRTSDLDSLKERLEEAKKGERACVDEYGDRVRGLEELEQKIEELKKKKGLA